jgi:hypothetical protein
VQLSALDPLRRVLRVEVEREPRHLGAEPALEPLGRGLADAAERSDVVRPDENVKTAQGTTSSLVPPDQQGSAPAVGRGEPCGSFPPESLGARLCGASLRRAPMDDGAAPLTRSVEHAHCLLAVGHLLVTTQPRRRNAFPGRGTGSSWARRPLLEVRHRPRARAPPS